MDDREWQWHYRWMNRAKEISKWSKDPSTKVGAVIVRQNNTAASEGYNGFPRGMSDDSKLYEDREVKYSRIIHAELNALLFSNEDLAGCTLYTFPVPPCDRCAVAIIQSGIKKVVAAKPSRSQGHHWRTEFEKTEQYFKEAEVEFIIWPY